MHRWGNLVATRPVLVITAIVIGSFVVAAGMVLTEPASDTVNELVPDDTDLRRALDVIDERFAEQGQVTTAQLIIRGSVLDPEGLVALGATVDRILVDPVVEPFLDPNAPPVTHAAVIAGLAGVPVGEITAADVEVALVVGNEDEQRALLNDILVPDDVAPTAAVGWIQLRRGAGTADEQLAAERRIGDLLEAADLGPTTGRALTNAAFEDASDEALADATVLLPLAAGALLVVLAIAYRAPGDVLSTFAAMLLVTVVVLGAEGWLGPNGVGLLGGSTAIAVVIPALMIGLTVDYALQITSNYRAGLARRESPATAAAAAVGSTGGAVALGAATTALSFGTNVLSPLGPVRDFGIVAAIGVVAGLVVMTGFVPAVRVLADPRKGRHAASLRRGDVLSDLPGVSGALRWVMGSSARRPTRVLVSAAAVGAVAVVVALGIDVRFAESDFLPADSDFIVDADFLEEQAGGSDSTVTAVVVGDLGDPSVEGNLRFIEEELGDEAGRPDWVVGDPLVATSVDGGDDAATITVAVRLGDEAEHRDAIAWFEDRWTTSDSDLTLTGELVLPIVVTDAVVRGQLIATTVVVVTALVVLSLFFARTARRAVLGPVVVAPIVLVLALIIATMTVLDVPYNALTATLAALTIGIGVDYTIHVVHRHLAELHDGADFEESIAATAIGTGGALVASAATTGVGFGVLVLADLPAVSQLGALTLLTVVYSLIVAVTVVPALLAVTHRSGRAADAPTGEVLSS